MAGVVEMVVILRHVSHDAEAVWNFHGDHIIGIQQSWNTQLSLRQFKGQAVILVDILLGERIKVSVP